MGGVSVFDVNILTATSTSSESEDCQVQTLMTPNTVGPIDGTNFLQYTNSGSNNHLGSQNQLEPGNEQILCLSGSRAININGDLQVYIAGAPPTGTATEPDALNLAVGQDRITLAQGLGNGGNQTGIKEEFWDAQTTTNMDQVKVSYFIPNSITNNDKATRYSFGDETTIQWGNRTLTRYSTETLLTVGNTSTTQYGNLSSNVDGTQSEMAYSGYNVESVAGGANIDMVAGLNALYQEGFIWNVNMLAMSMTVYVFNGILQLIGTLAALINTDATVAEVEKGAVFIRGIGVRIRDGATAIFNNLLQLGLPRI